MYNRKDRFAGFTGHLNGLHANLRIKVFPSLPLHLCLSVAPSLVAVFIWHNTCCSCACVVFASLEKARFGVVTSAFWDCFGNVTAQLYEAKANKKNISVNSVHFCFSSLSFFFSFFFFCSCSLQEVWLEQVSWKVSFGDKCDIHHATTVVQTKLL